MRAHLAACATLLASAPALAQTDAVKLDWEADAKCPPESAFVDQVHARSPRVRIDAAAPRTLVVRIARAGPERMSGKIELRDADGTVTQRSVVGASCGEVVEALGLVAAVALNPFAAGAGTNAGTPDAGGGTAAGAGTSHATSNGTPSSNSTASGSTSSNATGNPTSNVGAPAGTTTERRDDASDARPVNAPPHASDWGFVAGVDGEILAGPTPDPMFAMPVFFEVAKALSSHVAIGAGVRFERVGESTDRGDFTWTVGATELCVVLVAGRVRLDACGRGHFGVIDARGDGVTPARTAARPWADLGAAVAFRVRVVGPLFVEAQGFGGFALVQDRFFVEPSTTVFQVPLLTGHAGAGLGFEIW